jgi:choline dehydrogenase
VRDRLTIAGNALVDRVLFERGRARGVALAGGERVEAEIVVLAGGTYGSPAVLLRSGVGPPDALRALGIAVASPLPGVGENLHDQPFVLMTWEGSDEIRAAMDRAAAGGWAPDEQVMAKAATSADPDVFDLHLLPYSPTHLGDGRTFHAGVAALRPCSRGRVALASRDPEVLPLVDHGFLTDSRDGAALAEGVALLREIASQPELRRLLGRELVPGPGVTDIAAFARAHLDNYWHPVGTCALGEVVDARGQVLGVEGCYVADCAVMPFIPRATTMLPGVVVAERVAELLTTSAPGTRP